MSRQHGRFHRVSGFGIVEVMIAMTLGIVIILGVTTLFTDTSRTLSDISRSGRQIENALFTLDLLSTELSLTGYWGEANYPIDAESQVFVAGEDISSAPATPWVVATDVPPVCLGTGNSITGTTDNAKAELAYAMEYPVQGGLGSVVNANFAGGVCNGSGGVPRASSEYFVIRRASTCATGAPPIPANNSCRVLGDDYHLQVNGCFSENLGLSGGEIKLYKVNDSNVGTTLTYTGYDCATAAPVYRFESRVYYVDQSDTLWRMSLGYDASNGMQYAPEALVQGVELLRYEWFVDTSGDGIYDVVRHSADHGSPEPYATMTASEWPNVVAVRIWLVVRSMEPEPGYSDDRTYTIADHSWTPPSANLGYRRVVQSRTVDLSNIGSRRR